MTNQTAGDPAGMWLSHFFADDLRMIIETDLPRIRPRCSPDEMRRIREQLNGLRQYCSAEVDPPQPADLPEPEKDASPADQLIYDISCFGKRLGDEWKHLDRTDRRRLRAALARVLSTEKPVDAISDSIHWEEFLIAGFAIFAWLVLFAIGYTVHAGPYEDVIKEPLAAKTGTLELAAFVGALFMFIISCIPTNVLLLACLTGTLGTAYRRATGHSDHSGQRSKSHDYLCALTTSFFVYIILIGGLLSLSVAEVLTYETQEKYLKLAGTVSVFAFLVGYDRHLVAWMLRRAATFLTQAETASTGSQEPPKPASPTSSPKTVPQSGLPTASR